MSHPSQEFLASRAAALCHMPLHAMHNAHGNAPVLLTVNIVLYQKEGNRCQYRLVRG